MKARFNPTGTHIHKGFLKVRIDLYSELGNKTYPIHYVQVPVIPLEGYQGEVNEEGSPVNVDDYNGWIESLPKIWQLNPCLCHFIKVNPDISLLELSVKLREFFDAKTLLELDDALSKFETLRVQQIMRTKLGDGQVISKVTKGDIDKLNTRLSALEIKV